MMSKIILFFSSFFHPHPPAAHPPKPSVDITTLVRLPEDKPQPPICVYPIWPKDVK